MMIKNITYSFFGLLTGLLFGAILTHTYYEPPVVLSCKADMAEIVKRAAFRCKDSKDCLLLAEAGYFEARSEGREGMRAVMEVVVNRVESKYWPDTIEGVLGQPHQFEYKELERLVVNDKMSWDISLQVAGEVFVGASENVTEGANHFLNVRKMKKLPRWTKEYEKVAVVGNHTFYRRD